MLTSCTMDHLRYLPADLSLLCWMWLEMPAFRSFRLTSSARDWNVGIFCLRLPRKSSISMPNWNVPSAILTRLTKENDQGFDLEHCL